MSAKVAQNPRLRAVMSVEQWVKLRAAQKAYVANDPRWAAHRQKAQANMHKLDLRLTVGVEHALGPCFLHRVAPSCSATWNMLASFAITPMERAGEGSLSPGSPFPLPGSFLPDDEELRVQINLGQL